MIETQFNIDKTPCDDLDKLIVKYQNEEKEKHKMVLVKRRTELEENLKNFAQSVKETIKDTTEKLLKAIELTVKFVEENAPKIKSIIDMSIDIAVNIPKSDFKLSLALKILSMIFEMFDREDVINKINYLVGVFFPKASLKDNNSNNVIENEKTEKKKKKKTFYKTILR
jgi:hypothetical protein